MIARRRLLGTATIGTAGALITSGVTSGCQLVDADDSTRSKRSAEHANDQDARGAGDTDERPDPDLPMLRRLIATEQELLRTYRTTIEAVPGLPDWCRTYRDEHRQHLRQLRSLAENADGAGETDENEPDPAGPPGNRQQAIRSLRAGERQLVQSRDQWLGQVHGGSLARLIASVTASHALHASRLGEEQE